MIRCIRKLFTLAVVLVLLAAFGYSVVLPRVLPFSIGILWSSMRRNMAWRRPLCMV